jgi:putative ABC transport system ATP-binding protein
MIEVNELSKRFRQQEHTVVAVDSVSFSVPDGQFATIVGTSGSGKSTLLSLLGGLDRPTSGTVRVDDKIISSSSDHELIAYRSSKVGFVFQSFNLVPNLTALQNVMLPMAFGGVPRTERAPRATQILNAIGLTDLKQSRRPARLSGGEQQRVAVARALANRPRVVLADEPTGNLDSQTGRLIFDLLRQLSHESGVTVVVVTHDPSIAGRSDVTYALSDGKLLAA